MAARIRFSERPCLNEQHLTAPLQDRKGTKWMPIISCPAQFPLELFETALMTLIKHPEYNSTLILRTEMISDEHGSDGMPYRAPSLLDYTPTRNLHRRLLPRRPGRDAPLEQDCTLYASDGVHVSVLVLTPHLSENEPLPYYHPAVAHIAFRYVSSSLDSPSHHLVIEIVPLNEKDPIDISSRIYRTCLSLLEALDRYGWGAANNYQKRVTHDVLVPRSSYQDLYRILRERHKTLVDQWHEATDPLKHVFEDVGIATFLMLLWKETYSKADVAESSVDSSQRRPWDDWPRPPGGFVDIGCGNGLLTHILLSEGYLGDGFDVRARTSWSHYPPETQRHLHVQPFTPSEPHPHLRPSSFLIGNHADELTPWMPVLATLLPASGYLSIPCCPWDFDARFERGKVGPFHVSQSSFMDDEKFVEALSLGRDSQGKSAYSKYRVWLACLSRACGWKVECEMLRIPSTRNWAIIGRERIEDDSDACKKNAEDIVSAVRERGAFKARKPEGKAGH